MFELAPLTNLLIILDVEEEEEANEAHDAESDEDEHHVDSDDLLLPWSCCASMWLKQQEEIEKRLNEPEALANTIRHRLMAKNQVREKCTDGNTTIISPFLAIKVSKMTFTYNLQLYWILMSAVTPSFS